MVENAIEGKGNKKSWSRKLVDHTGKKYHFLTAIRFVNRDQRRKGTMWLLRCDCGKEVLRNINDVKSGHTKSCGCWHVTRLGQLVLLPDSASFYKKAYLTHKHGATRRGFISWLTEEQHTSIIKKPCAYCGGYSNRAASRKSDKRTVKTTSVDRVDNEPYYKLENTVPACFTCQRMKSALPKKVFLEHVLAIAAHVVK